MTRLLNANFARLFKGKLFWICAGAAVSLGLIEVFTHIKNPTNNPDYVFRPEVWLFNMSGVILLIITAILVGVFVGAEHGGVLRNKIIVGQKRITVYFADLLTCCIGIVIIHALFVAAVLLTGLLCGGENLLKFDEIFFYELLQLASLLEMCAFFTALTMLIPKKLAGTIAALVMVFAFFFISNSIPGKLFEIERKVEGAVASAAYIVEKEILTIVQDVLPLGQHDQIRTGFFRLITSKEYELAGETYGMELTYPIEIAPSALCVFVLTTAVGTLVFRKKNIK